MKSLLKILICSIFFIVLVGVIFFGRKIVIYSVAFESSGYMNSTFDYLMNYKLPSNIDGNLIRLTFSVSSKLDINANFVKPNETEVYIGQIIQEANDKAIDGDVIIVSPGIYNDIADDSKELVDEEGYKGCIFYYKDEDGDGYGIDEESKCLDAPEVDVKYAAIYPGDTDDQDPNVVETNMDVSEGWSMISLPVLVDNPVLSDLFSGAVVVYGYKRDVGYIRVQKDQELEFGKGYWILLDKTQNYMLTGRPIEDYSYSVEDGWHMIGGCSYAAQASVTNGNITVIYSYVPNSGYQRIQNSDNIEPGQGYWILLSEPTQIKVYSKTTSNSAPVADAGIDQTVLKGSLVSLDGSGSFDPEGDPLTYRWSFISKPDESSATLIDFTTANPSFTPDVVGMYEISLLVNDGYKDSNPDTVVVTVKKVVTPPISEPSLLWGTWIVNNSTWNRISFTPGFTYIKWHKDTGTLIEKGEYQIMPDNWIAYTVIVDSPEEILAGGELRYKVEGQRLDIWSEGGSDPKFPDIHDAILEHSLGGDISDLIGVWDITSSGRDADRLLLSFEHRYLSFSSIEERIIVPNGYWGYVNNELYCLFESPDTSGGTYHISESWGAASIYNDEISITIEGKSYIWPKFCNFCADLSLNAHWDLGNSKQMAISHGQYLFEWTDGNTFYDRVGFVCTSENNSQITTIILGTVENQIQIISIPYQVTPCYNNPTKNCLYLQDAQNTTGEHINDLYAWDPNLTSTWIMGEFRVLVDFLGPEYDRLTITPDGRFYLWSMDTPGHSNSHGLLVTHNSSDMNMLYLFGLTLWNNNQFDFIRQYPYQLDYCQGEECCLFRIYLSESDWANLENTACENEELLYEQTQNVIDGLLDNLEQNADSMTVDEALAGAEAYLRAQPEIAHVVNECQEGQRVFHVKFRNAIRYMIGFIGEDLTEPPQEGGLKNAEETFHPLDKFIENRPSSFYSDIGFIPDDCEDLVMGKSVFLDLLEEFPIEAKIYYDLCLKYGFNEEETFYGGPGDSYLGNVEFFKHLNEYSLIYISTHSRIGDLTTNEYRNEKSDLVFHENKDFKNDRVRIVNWGRVIGNVLGMNIRAPRYRITAKFLEKYLQDKSFDKHSLIILSWCYSADPYVNKPPQLVFSDPNLMGRGFVDTLINLNAGVVLGWDREVFPDSAKKTMDYLFDRLLGDNKVKSQEPPIRPYDIVYSYVALEENGLAYDPRTGSDSNTGSNPKGVVPVPDLCIPLPPRPPTKLLMFLNSCGMASIPINLGLRPSIQSLSLNLEDEELEVAGLIGCHGGEVCIEDSCVDVTPGENWDCHYATIPCPADARGDVTVRVNGRESNALPLSQWKGVFSVNGIFRRNYPGLRFDDAKFKFRARGEINRMRDMPEDPATDDEEIAYFEKDSKCEINFSGKGEDACYIYEYSGQMSISVGQSEPTSFYGGEIWFFPVNAPSNICFALVGFNEIKIKKTDKETGVPTDEEADVDIDIYIELNVDEYGTIQGDSIQYSDDDWLLEIKWNPIDPEYPPDPDTPV